MTVVGDILSIRFFFFFFSSLTSSALVCCRSIRLVHLLSRERHAMAVESGDIPGTLIMDGVLRKLDHALAPTTMENIASNDVPFVILPKSEPKWKSCNDTK